MNLILWRHAEAEDGPPDLERRLTPRGQKHAQQVAEWLLQRLPAKFVVLASPARREIHGCPADEDRHRGRARSMA